MLGIRRPLRRGFTLIELLIVIAVIAILSAIAFVALDPLKRFQDARDARRLADSTEVLNAIKIDQIDRGGSYLPAIASMTAGEVFMVGTAVAGCDDANAQCDTDVTGDVKCVDLTGLVTAGKLGGVPVSPNGAGTWTAATTGYTLSRAATGIITVRSCESENTNEISVSR